MKVFNVKKLLTSSSFLRAACKRYLSQQNSLRKIALLPQRGMLEVHGRDSGKLLQGLITNDISLLTDEDHKVIHTYVLNVQGRIVYDLFIYRSQEKQDGNSFLLECDVDERDNLIQYLKRYKLRSKVKFFPREDLNIYAMFGDGMHDLKIKDLYNDPRLPVLGARLITDTDNIQAVSTNVKSLGHSSQVADVVDYSLHRYRTGVAEGVSEVSNGIPLEYNGAFLQSISFQKGCYVGQELVARAHFTGVIRKRVVPLTFTECLEQSEIENKIIYNKKNKRVGKVLGAEHNVGIGLMRLKESMVGDEIHLKLNNGEVGVTPNRPSWWPDSVEY